MTVTIERTYNTKQTTGIFTVDEKIICLTMELPWMKNERMISCVPEGLYNVIKQSATKYRPYNFFRFTHVPGRDGILIHKITYVKDLKGCIGVGKELRDLNKDGTMDMIRSGEALAELYSLLPDNFTVRIIS